MFKRLKGWKTNKTKLLKESGYKSIRGFRKENPEFANDAEAYAYLLQEYNKTIDMLNAEEKREQKTFLRQNVKEYKPDIKRIYEDIKKNKGKSIIVSYIKGNKIIKTITYDIPINNYKSWYSNLNVRGNWLGRNSDTFIWDEVEGGKLYIYEQNNNITNKKIVQYFREGITNCLLTPIHNWAKEKLETSESKTAKSRYSTMIKNIDEYSKKYVNGVPENAISEICNKLQVDILVETPFSDKKLVLGESIKKRLKAFRFINSRINHIDLNEIVIDEKPIEVTRKELYKIEDALLLNNEYYTYKKDMTGINRINTLSKCYKLKSDYNEVIGDFEINTGLNFCKIDDIDDAEISNFVRCGTHFNETTDFIDVKNITMDNIKSSDMTKAYASFKSCKYYNGFLGKITDFRKTNKIMGVGMYMITDLVIQDGLFKQYNDKMKMYVSNNIYTDAELKMLSHNHCSFKIIYGCWGVKPIDFDFNNDMLTKKDDENVPYYSKWTGLCYSKFLKKTFWIKGDDNFCEIIRQHTNATVKKYFNGEIQIEYDKKHHYHLSHITAFITAYMRLNVIEQLLNMNIDNVIRVCVDGIYHYGDIKYKNVFREKNEIRLGNDAGNSYCSNIHLDLHFKYGDNRKNYAKELHLGSGGCGKTHYNINDEGLIRKMYLSPSWKLARNKQSENGINVSVWARAITEDPERISEIKQKANVLIIDEVSMMNEEQKEMIFNIYHDMKLIFCGDLGFQLPCIEGIEMNKKGFDNIVKHSQDYRCNDIRLNEIKKTLREMIKHNLNIKEINNWCINEFRKLNRFITIDEMRNTYNINDMILTGTNGLKDYYTNLFDDVDFGGINKYYVKENNRLWSNGDIVIGNKPEKTFCEIRHAFTTHSIQGETAYHKLFIDTSKMFDSRMFYTAISRAKCLEQIYLLKPNEKILEMNKKN